MTELKPCVTCGEKATGFLTGPHFKGREGGDGSRFCFCEKHTAEEFTKAFPLDKTPCALEHPGEPCGDFKHLAGLKGLGGELKKAA